MAEGYAERGSEADGRHARMRREKEVGRGRLVDGVGWQRDRTAWRGASDEERGGKREEGQEEVRGGASTRRKSL